MEPTLKDASPSEELFRPESIRAVSTQELARARIARPWGVFILAGLSLPLLTGLALLLNCYSYEQTTYADGRIQKSTASPCGAPNERELVGVLVVDELQLAHLQEGRTLAVQFPALSDATAHGTVLCVSESAGEARPTPAGSRFDVVLRLDDLATTKQAHRLRAGMSIRAVTSKSTVKLMRLFTKEGNNGR